MKKPGLEHKTTRFSVEDLIRRIRDARSGTVKRTFLDALTCVKIHYPDLPSRRKAVMQLFNALAETGATAIVTDETRQSDTTMLEEHVADGVIRL